MGNSSNFPSMPDPSPAQTLRLKCRNGTLTAVTAGLAPGHIQANLLILPSEAASDFADLCKRNPVPCPLVAKSISPGNPRAFDNALAFSHDFDVRTDVPKYNIYSDGKLVASKHDIIDEWRDDHVAFLIGCSYSFEAELHAAGLLLRHWEDGTNVSMWVTNRKLMPAGRFVGACHVVSMRPYLPNDIERVREVTRPFLQTHGEPISWGWEGMKELGIKEIEKPDFGDVTRFKEGEVPVFWGCGVTPQVAVMEAGSRIQGKVIGHSPGYMVLLDMTEEDMFGKHIKMEDGRINGHC